MRYTGIQPQYFPRLHYFARILNTDIFVIRDECQFVKKHKYPDGKSAPSYQAHSPVKSANGLQFLTIPTEHKGQLPINQTTIAYHLEWMHDHLKALKMAYSRSKNFAAIYPELEQILASKYKNLAELNLASISWGIFKILNQPINQNQLLNLESLNQLLKQQQFFRLKNVKLASEMNTLKTLTELKANEKIIALCKEVGATEDFCGGTAVSAYMDHSIFEQNNIKIQVQNWTCKPYPQLFGKQQFIPNLSLIDLLMNASSQEVIDIINE